MHTASLSQTIRTNFSFYENGASYSKIIILAVLYFLAAKFGFSLAGSAEQVTSIWPPTGIALAAVLIWGYRIWPGIAIGAFAINFATNEPMLTAMGIAATNTLTALAGGYLLKEKIDFQTDLGRLRDVINLIIVGIVTTLISSTFGVVNLYLSNLLPASNFSFVWTVWWVGDFMGVLIVTPLILSWLNREQLKLVKQNRLEYSIFFALLLLTVGFIFFNSSTSAIFPSAYLIFPFVIFSALRLSQLATASTNFIIATLAVLGTAAGRGPFAVAPDTEVNLVSFLMYLFIVSMTGLMLTAAISEKKSAFEKIKHQSFQDLLTGLGNRQYFISKVEGLFDQPKNKLAFAVLKIDIDRFKTVVDSLGHDTSDRLLKETALRLRALQEKDHGLSRLGSNEFGMISNETEGQEGAVILAKKIFQSFEEPFFLNGNEIYITVSIGISTSPHDGEDVSTILSNAYAALRHAKSLGGNNYQFYYTALNDQALGQLTMENSLRKAVEHAEFELYYQPEIDLRTGQIVKTEALIRWNRPNKGLVLAAEFIGMAEVTGIIEELELQTLGVAIAQTARWHQLGHKIGVAVNLCARQFRNDNLIRHIEENLRNSGLPARYLELEVTERTLLNDFNRVREILSKLKKMGVIISIDDFNTGYSSLNYIKQFPFDILKIDRSFVSGIPENKHDCEIAKSVIQLAHNLKKGVIAEGVEQEKQMDFLIKNECDNAQGYLFSPALSAHDCLEFLKNKDHLMKQMVLSTKPF